MGPRVLKDAGRQDVLVGGDSDEVAAVDPVVNPRDFELGNCSKIFKTSKICKSFDVENKNLAQVISGRWMPAAEESCCVTCEHFSQVEVIFV